MKKKMTAFMNFNDNTLKFHSCEKIKWFYYRKRNCTVIKVKDSQTTALEKVEQILKTFFLRSRFCKSMMHCGFFKIPDDLFWNLWKHFCNFVFTMFHSEEQHISELQCDVNRPSNAFRKLQCSTVTAKANFAVKWNSSSASWNYALLTKQL